MLGDDDSEGVDAATSTGGVCSRTESGTKEDEPGASTEPQLATGTAPAEADQEQEQDPVMKQTPELLTWLAVAQGMLDDIKKADNMKKSEWLELQTSSRSLFLQMPKVGGMRTACCCPTVAHSSSITLTLELANARSHPTPGSSYPVSRISSLTLRDPSSPTPLHPYYVLYPGHPISPKMVKTSSIFSRTGRKKKKHPHKAASADSTLGSLPTDNTSPVNTTIATAAEMPAPPPWSSLGAPPRKPPPRLASIATTTALALSLPTRSMSISATSTRKHLMAAGASGAWCVWYENLAEAERAELLASIMEMGNDMLKQTYEATDQVRACVALGWAGLRLDDLAYYTYMPSLINPGGQRDLPSGQPLPRVRHHVRLPLQAGDATPGDATLRHHATDNVATRT